MKIRNLCKIAIGLLWGGVLCAALAVVPARAAAAETPWASPAVVYDFESYTPGAGGWASGSGWADSPGSTATMTGEAAEVISGKVSLKIDKDGTNADANIYKSDFLPEGKKSKIAFKARFYGGAESMDVWIGNWDKGYMTVRADGTITFAEQQRTPKNIDESLSLASAVKDGDVVSVTFVNLAGSTDKLLSLKPILSGNAGGVIVDDFTVSYPLTLAAAHSVAVNLAETGDVPIYTNAAHIGATISKVEYLGAALDASLYTVSDGLLSVDRSVFSALEEGGSATLTVTDTAGNSADTAIKGYRFNADPTQTVVRDFEEYADNTASFQAGGWDTGKTGAVQSENAVSGEKSLVVRYTGANQTVTHATLNDGRKSRVTFRFKFDGATELDIAGGDWSYGQIVIKAGAAGFTHNNYNADQKNIDAAADAIDLAYDSRTGVYTVGYTVFPVNASSKIFLSNVIGANGGIIFDDFTVQYELRLTADSRYARFNSEAPADLTFPVNTRLTGTTIAAVKSGDTALSDGDYAVADHAVTVKKEFLAGLDNGLQTLTIVDSAGSEATVTVRVYDAVWDGKYDEDFEGLDASLLTGGQASADAVWSGLGNFLSVDNGAQSDCTASSNGGLALKFTPKADAAVGSSFFTLNSNANKLTSMRAGAINRISFRFKGGNTSTFSMALSYFQPAAEGKTEYCEGQLFYLTCDLSDNTVTAVPGEGTYKDDVQDSIRLAGFDAAAQADGWYKISVVFDYRESDLKNAKVKAGATNAYFQIVGFKSAADSYVLLDDVKVETEGFPYFKEKSAVVYDFARPDVLPSAAVETYDRYAVIGVENVTDPAAPVELTADEYAWNNGVFTLAKSYVSALDAGSYAYKLTTDKGNALDLTLSVLDSTPVFGDTEAAFEKGQPDDVAFSTDFKGYKLDYVEYDGEVVATNYYQIDDAFTSFTFKKGYLAGLEPGSHTFALYSSSGVSTEFTVTVTDSRPVFAESAATYEKASAGGLTVSLNTFGKTIVSVTLDETTLAAADYAFADGRLEVVKTALDALSAGEHTLTVETDCGTAALTLTIVDLPPTASVVTPTASSDSDLKITLDTKGRDIVSVIVGDFVLTSADYAYADGTLTIHKAFIAELAKGEKTVTVTTAGGSVSVAFTVVAAPTKTDPPKTEEKKCGCGGVLTAGSLAAALLLLSAVFVTLRKRRA